MKSRMTYSAQRTLVFVPLMLLAVSGWIALLLATDAYSLVVSTIGALLIGAGLFTLVDAALDHWWIQRHNRMIRDEEGER